MAIFWSILSWQLRLPLYVLLGVPTAIYLAWTFSEGMAVRAAVKDYAVKFVAAAEISSLEAEVQAEKDLVTSLTGLAKQRQQMIDAQQDAIRLLNVAAILSDERRQEQDDEIDEIISVRVGFIPTLGELGIYNRLRNR